MRPPHTPVVSPEALAAAVAPAWVFPERNGAYRYDDVEERFRLEWTGPADGTYIIQYEAGEGERMLAGELHATGTVKDFGVISRRYWNTWIVPLRTFRLRVGPAGGRGPWSEWRTLEAEE